MKPTPPDELTPMDPATKFTGTPILSMRPGHFVGAVSKVEQDGAIRFCPVTQKSPVWKQIEAAMDQYRQTHGG
ncbi:hypothetical protein PI125_g6054 [Phytophthora idaei]|nr:hypothetical protein PI125_g6054 [Phytophthora idaei]KAG3156379.1 hypothetical protein PI126_g8801 [Phytophthora idaei]